MKKGLLIFLLPVLAFSIVDKLSIIKGHIKTPDPVAKVYLEFISVEGNRVNDSAEIVNGQFGFKTTLEEPTMAYLTAKYEKDNGKSRYRYERIQLFLEPGEIQVNIIDSLKFAKITGSEAHAEFERFTGLQKPYTDASRKYYLKYLDFRKEKNEEGMEKMEALMDSIDRKMNEEIIEPYLASNSHSPIALHVLKQYAGYDLDAKKIEPIFNKLSVATRNSPSGMKFKEQILIAKKTGIGELAMDFTQNDTLGNPVSLSSFRGKYVLLDFWASWCGPCRKENPNLVKAFHQFKEKNFTVLGISLDRAGAKEKWMDAIHKDGLTWTQVSDLKYWDNEVAKQYGIRAIPQNLLIDPEGRIIAKNIKGEELQKKLSEYLD